MKSALFRADASPEIGAGHVMRCSHLAEALTSSGWECTLAGKPGTLEFLNTLHSWPGRYLVLDGSEEEEPAFIKANGGQAEWDLLICDNYERGIDFETTSRSWANSILVIDDLPNRNHDTDILLDQTYGRHQDEYAGLLPKDCRVYTGATFALIGAKFKKLRASSLARRHGPVRKIFVSVGGGNPGGVLGTIVKAIKIAGLRLESHIVIGPMTEETDAIIAEASLIDPQPVIHYGTRDMAALMAEADIAIGVAGTTSWERCCLGLPAIIMSAADNQRDVAKALSNSGACLLIGDAAKTDADNIARHLQELITNHEARWSMAKTASTICDGEGTMKIASILDKQLLLGVPH